MNDARLIESHEIADWTWQRVMRAADDPADAMRLVTLATVTPEHRPSARMMVLRGAERGAARIWFHTHAADGKVADLSLNPAATVVAWDAESQVQVRLSGYAGVHRLDQVARMNFDQGSSLRARLAPVGDAGAQEPAAAEFEGRSAPDLLWPGASEELVHALTHKAWRRFAVIELSIGIIETIQSVRGGTRRFVLRASNDWQAAG
ncbi:MAG TPA: pyridoxamine 5'-phosphate oxidase family protein [Phycisphaerales bacterium]|nr:pyridoxamine 5'-phosphate oxidase family protein [Phycisphaerales bacterium]HMP36695.1 pyridoxamine 5'-phosphate oxidase family protein [Phycisphaerales bacterium]